VPLGASGYHSNDTASSPRPRESDLLKPYVPSDQQLVDELLVPSYCALPSLSWNRASNCLRAHSVTLPTVTQCTELSTDWRGKRQGEQHFDIDIVVAIDSGSSTRALVQDRTHKTIHTEPHTHTHTLYRHIHRRKTHKHTYTHTHTHIHTTHGRDEGDDRLRCSSSGTRAACRPLWSSWPGPLRCCCRCCCHDPPLRRRVCTAATNGRPGPRSRGL
jgi:hypothetical protein